MSNRYDWNTNFIYTEELTSDNMNSSQVGYMLPGVYNSNFYFSTDSNGTYLYFNIKAGTTVVFSHNKDQNNDFLNNSFSSVTKCVCAKDTQYDVFGPNTEKNYNKQLYVDVLSSDTIFVCLAKKVIPSSINNDTSSVEPVDIVPALVLIAFIQEGTKILRKELSTTNDLDTTINIDGGEKVYYHVLGVLHRTNKNGDYIQTRSLSYLDWINDHLFTSRYLPAYNHSYSLDDNSVPCNFVTWKNEQSSYKYNIFYDKVLIDNIIFSKKADWKVLYNWMNFENNSLYNNSGVFGYSLDTKTFTEDDIDTVFVDFIYAKINIEKVGDLSIENIFSDENSSNIELDKYSFETKDSNVFDIIYNCKSTLEDGSYVRNTCLYSDTSKNNIERLLSLIENKNVLPLLYNKIRFESKGIGVDTIIPVAISFRTFEEHQVATVSGFIKKNLIHSINPMNTLCFFEIQKGNYSINSLVSSFKIADIIPALADDTIDIEED